MFSRGETKKKKKKEIKGRVPCHGSMEDRVIQHDLFCMKFQEDVLFMQETLI